MRHLHYFLFKLAWSTQEKQKPHRKFAFMCNEGGGRVNIFQQMKLVYQFNKTKVGVCSYSGLDFIIK